MEKAEQFSSSEEVEEEEEQGDSNSLLLLEETENSSDMGNQNTRREEEHSDEKSGINLSTKSQAVEHRVYPIRWFMLAAMIVLNISNGMVSDVLCTLTKYKLLFHYMTRVLSVLCRSSHVAVYVCI